MSGRVNGMCKWRSGWRSDVLKKRNGQKFEKPLESTETCNEKHIDVIQLNQIKCSGNRFTAVWTWWNEVLCAPMWICAPMIGQSDRVFRILCRENGVGLCYTPMYIVENVNEGIHDAELFIHKLDEERVDRPIACQLAGNDVEAFVSAAQRIQHCVDAIDINLSCPQRCAEIGNYGAFLLHNDLSKTCTIIRALAQAVQNMQKLWKKRECLLCVCMPEV